MGTISKKTTGTAKSMPVGLTYGWCAEMMALVLFCTVSSFLVLSDKMSWSTVGYGTMIVLLGSSYLGAMISSKAIKRRKLMVCLIAGILYMSTLLLITVLFFGGQFEAVGITALLIIGGCISAALLDVPKKGSRTARKRKAR